MSKWTSAVTDDLQCRFSAGETPTWQEFYYWIEQIQAAIEAHEHLGAGEGDADRISFDDLADTEPLFMELDALDIDVGALELTLEELEGTVDTLDTVQGMLLEGLSGLGVDVHDLEEAVDGIDEQLPLLWEEAQSANYLAYENQQRLDSLEGDLDDLDLTVSDVATDVFYMGGDIEELWYSVGQVEDLVYDVESDNFDQWDMLDDHEWRLTALEAGIF